MFGWLKNKGLELKSNDLSNCITYTNIECDKETAAQICNQLTKFLIIGFIRNNEERLSLQSVCNIYLQMKNAAIKNHNLKNHKNSEFAASFMALCFFESFLYPNENAYNGWADRILNTIKKNADKEYLEKLMACFKKYEII